MKAEILKILKKEKEIKKEELSSFSAVRLFNAMIGWGAIEFPVANVSD